MSARMTAECTSAAVSGAARPSRPDSTAPASGRTPTSTFDNRSALHRLALFANGPALLDLADVLVGVGNLAGCVAHVHVDDADLLGGPDRMVRQRLHITAD